MLIPMKTTKPLLPNHNRLISLAIALSLSGCASKSMVYTIGKDTYTYTHAVREAAVRDANLFCIRQGKNLKLLRERTIDDAFGSTVIDFSCVSLDSPLYQDSEYKVETRPDITIEQK